MIEKILNNTTPYGKIRASHEGLLHSSTLNRPYPDGLVGGVSASHTVGHGFVPGPGHTKDHHKIILRIKIIY